MEKISWTDNLTNEVFSRVNNEKRASYRQYNEGRQAGLVTCCLQIPSNQVIKGKTSDGKTRKKK
jgi:hypothetical protein